MTTSPPHAGTRGTPLGLGIGWRPELALAIHRRAAAGRLGFVEIIAEDVRPTAVPDAILELRRLGVQVVPHGVSLSLGGVDPVDRDRVKRLADLADRLGSPLVSEHMCFVRAGGVESGHLLPLPRTRVALDVLVENTLAARELLPVPLALENIASLVEWPGAEMTEAAFVAAALERTGSRLLLDVANVWANARNGGTPAADLLAGLPLDRLAYVHVAGGADGPDDALYHDTHTRRTPPGVLTLLANLCRRAAIPGVMLERDGRFPVEAELFAELDDIAAAAGAGVPSSTTASGTA
ncbi:MAG: hypothetical protein JWO31_1103 [Phycisphaerales bacterium]|nr:hypothetical protein [Phycisphaerales bacterium]